MTRQIVNRVIEMLFCVFMILLVSHARAEDSLLQLLQMSLGPEAVGSQVYFGYSAAGGVAPYRFRVSAGMLPAGLVISPEGVLSGTLASAGRASYELAVMDAAGSSAAAVMTFDVTPPSFGDRVEHTRNFLFTGRSGLWIADGANILAQFFDYRTTIKCARLPGGVCAEANPVLLAAGIDPATARGARKFLLLKTLGPTLVLGSQQLLTRKLHFTGRQLDGAIAGTWASAIGQGAVDYHNHRLTEKLQAARAGPVP